MHSGRAHGCCPPPTHTQADGMLPAPGLAHLLADDCHGVHCGWLGPEHQVKLLRSCVVGQNAAVVAAAPDAGAHHAHALHVCAAAQGAGSPRGVQEAGAVARCQGSCVSQSHCNWPGRGDRIQGLSRAAPRPATTASSRTFLALRGQHPPRRLVHPPASGRVRPHADAAVRGATPQLATRCGAGHSDAATSGAAERPGPAARAGRSSRCRIGWG